MMRNVIFLWAMLGPSSLSLAGFAVLGMSAPMALVVGVGLGMLMLERMVTLVIRWERGTW